MRMITVSVFKREHLVLLGVSDPDFFKDCFGVRMDAPDLSDPFNWSGLPYHIKQKVVSDFRATQEDQFVQDWVNEAPQGEVRIGSLLNHYGNDRNYKVFHEFLDYPVSSHRQGMFEQHEAQNRRLWATLGLPEHLMQPSTGRLSMKIPNYTNEVSYNGVKLSQLEIPAELEPTRKLVIEFINEIAVEDHPNLLTLFVGRGGNICDLTEFFSLVKVAAEKYQILEESFEHDLRGKRDLQRLQQLADTTMHQRHPSTRREPPVRSREDERGHEQYLRDSVHGIFQNNLCPEIYNPTPISDRDHTKLAIKATPEQIEEYAKDSGLKTIYKDGEFLPRVTGAYAVGTDGVKRDLRDIDFMDLLLSPIEGDFIAPPSVELNDVPNRRHYGIPIHESLDAEGNVSYQLGELNEKPLEGRIPHVARFSDIVSSMSQQGRNETMAVYIEPVLTPEEIVDREQAIQEASEGKLDYLLEGTQWDPKNRK